MRVLKIASASTPAVLVEAEAPTPVPGEGEILVRIRAAGLIPTELSWYPTWHTKDGGTRSGALPSHEFAGEVAATGPGVAGLSVADEIYGMNDWFEQGALAEYCLSRPEWIAPKPRTLSFAEAAAVPISALTAWQALFDRAKLSAGERVLIHGGAGAVGSFAIQFAHCCGAHVITTVSAHNAAFVKALGADEAIDYRVAPFENSVHETDVVLDTIGGETLERSWGVLKPSGRMVTIAARSESSSDERVKRAFLLVEARAGELLNIATAIDAGQIRPVVDTVVSMSQVPDVYSGALQRSGRGKVVMDQGFEPA